MKKALCCPQPQPGTAASQGGREEVPAVCYDTDEVLALVDLWWLATGCPQDVPS